MTRDSVQTATLRVFDRTNGLNKKVEVLVLVARQVRMLVKVAAFAFFYIARGRIAGDGADRGGNISDGIA